MVYTRVIPWLKRTSGYVHTMWERVREIFRGPRGSTVHAESYAESESSVHMDDSYGHCLCCGGSWAVKRPHWTFYSDAGMGPVCEECYDELSPEERLPYYVKLWESWGSPEDVDFSLIRQGIGLEG